jgi:hypothetical protein
MLIKAQLKSNKKENKGCKKKDMKKKRHIGQLSYLFVVMSMTYVMNFKINLGWPSWYYMEFFLKFHPWFFYISSI